MKRLVLHNRRLRNMYSYRHWCRRSKRSKLGIDSAKSRTDLCDYCHRFDFVDSKTLSTILNTTRSKISAIDETAMQVWDQQVSEIPQFQEAAFISVASPRYLNLFASFLDALVPAATLSAEAAAELRALASHVSGKFTAVDGWISRINDYNNHWKLRDIQNDAFQHDLLQPDRSTLYFHLDMQDSSCVLFDHRGGCCQHYCAFCF